MVNEREAIVESRGPNAESRGGKMYNALWDVDVNHSEEVYVVRDEADATVEEYLEELPFHIPRD